MSIIWIADLAAPLRSRPRLESLAREVPGRVAVMRSWSWGFFHAGTEEELALVAELADQASFDLLAGDPSFAAARKAVSGLVKWEGAMWTDDEFPCVERDDVQRLSYNGLLRYVAGTPPGRRERMKEELVEFGLQHPDIKTGMVGFCTPDMTDGWELMWQWQLPSKEAAQRYWRRPGHGTFLRRNDDTFVLGGDGVSTGHSMYRPGDLIDTRGALDDDRHRLALTRHVVLVSVSGQDARPMSARLQATLRQSTELDARAVTVAPFSSTNVLQRPGEEEPNEEPVAAVVADFDDDDDAHGPQLIEAIRAAIESAGSRTLQYLVYRPSYPHLLHTVVEPDGRLSLLVPCDPWRPADVEDKTRSAGW